MQLFQVWTTRLNVTDRPFKDMTQFSGISEHSHAMTFSF